MTNDLIERKIAQCKDAGLAGAFLTFSDLVVLHQELTRLRAAQGVVTDAVRELLDAGKDELIRKTLTSHPRKFEFAKQRGFDGLDAVHNWMADTAQRFEYALVAALAAEQEDKKNLVRDSSVQAQLSKHFNVKNNMDGSFTIDSGRFRVTVDGYGTVYENMLFQFACAAAPSPKVEE